MTTEIKKLQFASGVNVTAPADLTSVSSTNRIDEYVDDAAFVTANGTAQPGDIYINTTFKTLRIFTGSAWRNHIVGSDAADATKQFKVDVAGNTTSVVSTLVFSDTVNSSHNVSPGTGTIPKLPINLSSQVTATLPIGNGGTGQTTASGAINALAPTQTGNIGRFLRTDGSAVSWADIAVDSTDLNAVLNPNNANLGWNGGTGHTVAGIGSGGSLSPVIATGIRVTATANGTESSTSGGGYTVSVMPTGLYNSNLKLEFYYIAPASGTWRVSLYRGGTRVALSTDVSSVSTLTAGFNGLFTATFTSDTSTGYSIRFTRTAGSGTTDLDLTKVTMAPTIGQPGNVAQGVAGLVAGAGQLLGTNTNDNAAAGRVGQYVEFIQTTPITLTNAVASDIATMSLTSGDWDVWAVSSFDSNGTTVSQVLSVNTGISTVSVTPSSFPGQWFNQTLPAYNSASFGAFYVSSPVQRVSFASTSSVYCVGISLFTAGAGTLRAFSTKLMARRVR